MCLKIDSSVQVNFRAPESHIRTHAYHLWENTGKPNKCFWDEAEKECNYVLGYKVVRIVPAIEGAWQLGGGPGKYVASPVRYYKWQDGWNDSGRKFGLLPSEAASKDVNSGFHVYLDPQDAHSDALKLNLDTIIQVHCYQPDCVAVGYYYTWHHKEDRSVEGSRYKAAVFTKVFVPPHTIENILK
jgi:hypothetical protein